MEDLKAKGLQESELHSQREKLMKEQHENVERGDLIASYAKEAEEYDQLIRDVNKQR